MAMKGILTAFVAIVAATSVFAATLSYTPQGSAPYYWDNATAWGGVLPGSDDDATINNATFRTSPLTIQGGTSAAGFLHVDNGTLYVEPNATLSAKNSAGSDGGIYFTKSASSTGVVTNYGTITTYKLDLGEYNTSKGTLARFDNFGTLTIENTFRFQMDGTPSIFHNHANGTVRKTGGNGWTFYFGYKGVTGSYSTLINEGDFFDNTYEMWMGLSARSYSQNDIIVNGNGRFFAAQNVSIGATANSLATITLNDNGYLSGNAKWRLGGRGTTASTVHDREEGRIVLNGNSTFAASNHVYVGFAKTGKGSITLNESSRMTLDVGELYLGYDSTSTGTVSVCDSASLIFPKSYMKIGVGASSYGLFEAGDTSCVTSPTIIVASGANSTGTLALSGNCQFVEPQTFYVGYNNGAKGYYTLKDSARADHGHYFWVGGQPGAIGTVSLCGNSYVSITNNILYVGKANSATGIVLVADNAVLNATNIIIAYESSAVGTLEVAGAGVVSNVTRLVIGPGERTTSRALLKMSGGTVLFNGEIIYESNGVNVSSPLAIDSRTTNTGLIRGWGKIAFEDPIAALRDAASPRGFLHYGQIFADGGGVMRDLDFSRFGVMGYDTTSANPNGTNGWFAVNKGRLKLPRSVPNRSGYKCVGDYWTTDVALGVKNSRLANTFNYEFTGATLNDFVFSELYATDREDIPAGLDAIGADRTLAVWRVGYFSDGPEIDEPTHPSSFTSAKLKFKFSPLGLDGLYGVYVYRHDGTVNGKWVRTGKRTDPSTMTMPIISTGNFGPSSENWNLGWFAIVGRTKPFGTAFNIR